MNSLAKFLRMPAADKRAVLFCLWALPAASLLSPILGAYWARESVGRTSASDAAPCWRVIERVTHLVEGVAGRLWRRPSCLARSVVLRYLLRARGIETNLRIAVRLEGRRLDAHCWLECAGTPVYDAPGPGDDFRALPDPAPRR